MNVEVSTMGEALEVKVDERGCITLPREGGERLGLLPGTILRVETSAGGSLRLQIDSTSARIIRKGSVLVIAAEPNELLSDVVERHREERLADVSARGRA